MTFSGGGSLTFEAPESGTRTVTLASATTLGDLASVTFPADATLVLDGNEIVAQTAPVTALGNLTLTTAGTVGLDTWAGDITLTSSSALTLSAATAGTVLAIDGVILAGVILPQQTNIENAESLLAQRQSDLNAIKIEYEREQANLEYMQTDEYKLQQGSVRYGWHYSDDSIILDSDSQ